MNTLYLANFTIDTKDQADQVWTTHFIHMYVVQMKPIIREYRPVGPVANTFLLARHLKPEEVSIIMTKGGYYFPIYTSNLQFKHSVKADAVSGGGGEGGTVPILACKGAAEP